MIYWQNRILTNVKKALGNKCATVVATTLNSKARFPAMMVKVVSNASTADDLEYGEENAVRCVVTIEAYSNVSLQEAVNLIGLANEAMYRMGFKRRQGPVELENIDAPEVSRVTARYLRAIGANDTIELFD